jgi:predicted permease
VPTIFRTIAARIRELATRSKVAAEQDEEFRFHLEMQTEENLRRGMPPDQARREARVAFGGEQKFREATHDSRGFAALEGTFREVALAARRLRRRPGLVAAVVVTLALGIGANTAVFSLIDAVLLHPVAVPGADRVFVVYTGTSAARYGDDTYADYEEFARNASTLDGVAAYAIASVPLTQGDAQEDVDAEFVTDDYFATLRVTPAIGRAIAPSDPSDPGSNPVAVLSASFWHSHFNGNAAAIGTKMLLRGVPITIIGIMPDHFSGTSLSYVPDIWLPTSLLPTLQVPMLAMQGRIDKQMPLYSIVARLRAGVDSARATVELTQLQRRTRGAAWGSRYGLAGPISTAVIPLAHAAAGVVSRSEVLRIVRLLVAVVALMLLLACLNIANLFLLRAHERARELGVRMALGAGTGRIVQQLTIESLMLALLGGIVGVGVARVAMRAMSAFSLPGKIRLDHVAMGLNPRVLAVAFATTLVTAAVCGLVPGLRAARTSAAEVLRGRAANVGASRHRMVLTALQVALSLVLVVGGALLLRSIRAGFSTGIGFDPRGVAAVTLAPKFDGTFVENMRQLHAVVAELQRQPGVRAAAATTHVPLARFGKRPFAPGPAPDSGMGDAQTATLGVSYITPDFFDVLGVPLLRGRRFGDQDQPGGIRSIILNESAARALWPNASAVGRVVHGKFFGPIVHAYIVVGIVRDTKYGSLDDDRVPFAYVPLGQEDLLGRAVTFVARSRDPRGTLPVITRIVKDVAPDMKLATGNSPATRPRLVSDQIAATLAPQRLGAALLTALAVLALCVSGVGIYGTVSYSVSRRTAEIGIRKALGARSAGVVALVVRQTALAVGLGAVGGLIGAAASTRFLQGLLYGVGPFDVVSFIVASCVVALVAAGAALVPSLRSARIDPVRAIQTLG